MGICLKQLRSRVMRRNTSEKANMLINRLTRGQLSPFNTQRSAKGYPTSVNNIHSCPKRRLLMPLARVGARTATTTRIYSYDARAWPISAHAHWPSSKYACTEGLHFSAFHWVCLCVCLSVCLLSHISPTERLFVLKTLSCTQRAPKVKKFVGFSLKMLRC